MSSPLDRIQVRAQEVLDERRSHDVCDRGECWYPEVVAEAEVVLALVNVAKAVPGLLEIAEQAMPDSYFQSDSRVNTAREALAALDEKAGGK